MVSIKHLYIYQFGGMKQWEGKDLSANLNVFYGENEAGKTTIMQFITAILFGFSSRQQSVSRYEPKDGGRRGGKIVFHDPAWGDITVERVDSSKAAGDVTVFLENGEMHGEDFLKSWLNGLDKSFFQGIFSFGLDGLQQLELMSEKELGDFLLGAGMTGGENLSALEGRLERKWSTLFKPGGRKPVINSKIAELKDAEENLAKWKKKNESYAMLLREKEQKAAEKEELLQRITEAEKEIGRLSKWMELEPVLQKWSESNRYITGTGDLFFPEDGLRRYEAWRAQAVSMEGELGYLKEKMDVLGRETATSKYSSIAGNEDEIRLMGEQYHRYKLMKEEADSLHAALAENERSLREVSKEAGGEWTKEKVQSLILTLAAKNTWLQMFNSLQQLQQRKEILDDQLERSRKKLEEAEMKEENLRLKLMPEEDREKLVVKRQAFFQKRVNPSKEAELAAEYEYVTRLLKTEKNKSSYKQGIKWIAACLLLGVLLTAAAVFTSDILFYPALLLLFSGAFLAAGYWKKKQYVLSLEKEEEKLRRYKNYESDSLGMEDWMHVLEEEERRRSQWELALREVEEEEKNYHEIAHGLDQIELKEHRLYQEADTWMQDFGWNESPHMLFTAGILDVLGKIKDLYEEADRINIKLHKLFENTTSFERRVFRAAQEAGLKGNDPGFLLKEMHDLLNMKEKSDERLKEMERQNQSFAERSAEITNRLKKIEEETERLLTAAGCTDENEFYTAARAYESYFAHKQTLKEASLHLASLGYDEYQIKDIAEAVLLEPAKLDRELEQMKEMLSQWKNEKNMLSDEVSQLDYEIKMLLEDGTYSAAVHKFQQLKSELEHLAKEYAVYKITHAAIMKTREKYRTEKLPAVLEETSKLFAEASQNRYTRVSLNQDGLLYVQDQKNTRFSPAELSKGTAELLYLCIRSALAMHAGDLKMLMVMDDITVNFDKKRTVQAAGLVKSIASERQVLYFTCHEHVMEVFSDKKVYDLNVKSAV